jgi:hypothetical protein
LAASSEEEFASEFDAHWYPPRASLEFLGARGIGVHFAIESLIRRLRAGELKAVARSVTITSLGKRERIPFPNCPTSIWSGVRAPTVDYHSFWTVGDLDTVEDTGRGERAYAFFDIRFEPKGLALIAPQAQPKLPPVARPVPPYRAKRQHTRVERPPKVTTAELVAWLRGQTTRTRFTLLDVMQDAQKHFGERPVTRRPMQAAIGELGLTENRGKPTT